MIDIIKKSAQILKVNFLLMLFIIITVFSLDIVLETLKIYNGIEISITYFFNFSSYFQDLQIPFIGYLSILINLITKLFISSIFDSFYIGALYYIASEYIKGNKKTYKETIKFTIKNWWRLFKGNFSTGIYIYFAILVLFLPMIRFLISIFSLKKSPNSEKPKTLDKTKINKNYTIIVFIIFSIIIGFLLTSFETNSIFWGGLILLTPMAILSICYSFVESIILFENLTANEARKRSLKLIKNYSYKIIIITLVEYLFVYIQESIYIFLSNLIIIDDSNCISKIIFTLLFKYIYYVLISIFNIVPFLLYLEARENEILD